MAEIFMFRGVDYELGFNDYFQNDIKVGISSFLNKKQYQISNNEFSYRIINHWEKNKLTTSIRKGGTGWRKYSIMDRVWLYIIREMRDFGISLHMIQKVKNSLSQKKKDIITFPVLEYYISLALINKPAFLLVFPDGQTHPLTEKELAMNREFSSANNHFQINLNVIVQKLFKEKPLKIKFKEHLENNFDERRALQLLRLGNFIEYEVTYRDSSKQTHTNTDIVNNEDVYNLIYKKQYRQIKFKIDDDKFFVVKDEN